MKKYILFLFIILIGLTSVSFRDKDANSDAGSDLVTNYRQLNANSICTGFGNTGSFNYGGFIWPQSNCTGISARFISGLWIAAKVGNDTLVSTAYYNFDYLSGYTDNNGIPRGQNDPLYRIYKLTFGLNDSDRTNWPNALLGNSDQGAPVFYDSSTNSWKPLDFGHQTMYYVYTDSDPTGRGSGLGSILPLKADVKQLNFALNISGAQQNIIYQQFTIINRSTSVWSNAYITIWSDDDLGEYSDDKVACDSAAGLGYTYNATNNDPIYGPAPPAVGFVMLRGALLFTGNNSDTVFVCRNKVRTAITRYRDLGMTAFNYSLNSNGPEGDPRNFREAYNVMQGLRKDGSQRIHPNGYATRFVFSGDPVTNTGWVQLGPGDDQRLMLSSGPVNISPGDTQIIVIAQLIARGSSNLNSITILRQYAVIARQYYNSCYSTPAIGIENNNEIVNDFRLYQNYPNPFNPVTTIKYSISPSKGDRGMNVRLTIYDLLGKEIAVPVNEHLKPGTYEFEWNASDFPSGVYFYKLNAGDYSESKKMVLVK